MCCGVNILCSDAQSGPPEAAHSTRWATLQSNEQTQGWASDRNSPQPSWPLRNMHRMPVGVRKGPVGDQPKALIDPFVSPSSTNAWLWAGSFLAVPPHVYSSYSTIFTKKELHKWCWRGRLGHSLLLGLRFPPRHPALICFQHSSHSVCSSPCCWEPSCAPLHGLWNTGACTAMQLQTITQYGQMQQYRQMYIHTQSKLASVHTGNLNFGE